MVNSGVVLQATDLQMFPFAAYTGDTGLTGGIKHFVQDLREPGDRFESLLLLSLRNQLIGDWIYTRPAQLGGFYRGELELKNYPSYFFGIGNSNTVAQKSAFTMASQKLSYEWGQVREDRVRWSFLGEADLTSALSTDGSAVFSAIDTGAVNVYTVGFKMALDQLDRPQNPLAGEFLGGELRYAVAHDTVYLQGNVDYRQYLQIRHTGWTPTENGLETINLALRGYTGAQAGAVPFYHLFSLGGVNLLRGYAEGRFRDRSVLGLGLELRQDLALPADWHMPWPVQAAYFIEGGKVFDSWFGFTFDEFHASQGLGLRILLRPDAVVRVDYAFGEDEQGLYFAFGQAI